MIVFEHLDLAGKKRGSKKQKLHMWRSRYFVREILKSLPARERLVLEAKVPQVTKRSTCTLSTLINLNAELRPLVA